MTNITPAIAAAQNKLIENCKLTQMLLFQLQVENDKNVDDPSVLAHYIDVCQKLEEKKFNTATAYTFLEEIANLVEML